jgi:AcrR family transcriptional regulator
MPGARPQQAEAQPEQAQARPRQAETQPRQAEARPLRADARRNREAVLEAARTAFAAEGLTVALDEIARRAGVGPGTLYRHFPTKEALFEAVVQDRLRQLADEGAALARSADAGAAFFTFLDRLAAEAGPKRDLFDALASAGVEAGPAVMATADGLRSQITRLLTQAQQAGAVRADIGRADLTALLSGLLFAMRPRPGADQAVVLSVFRDGLRPQRG